MSAQSVIDRLLKIDHQELGRRDSRRSPLGSNNVKYNTWYYGRKVSGDDYMWCAAYQSWANAMAGVPMDIYPKAAGVVQVRDFFKEQGRILKTPKVGDYVIFIVGYARPEYDRVEDDMTKEELVDVLRAGFTPGPDIKTVNEWAAQLNEVKRDVDDIKRMLEEMKG
ncbi:MAG TPA: hypothetical protein VJB61_22745 [Actinomycetota bacterium]